ncbi:MAG: ABC transporter permease [Thiobacillaceae bacterium]|jgi:ABC-2 type transport system permease protein
MSGFKALFHKEILRFWKVAFQTVLAPVISAMLYLMIFSHVLKGRVQVFPGVSYTEFLIPGLVMMSALQNAFANSSSSLIQSKITGNIIFILLSPLSYFQLFSAYMAAAMLRGIVVGLGVMAVTIWFVDLRVLHPFWLVTYTFLSTGIFAALGINAGIWAEKFDQMAAFQNFIIMPLTFLSGVFYSIHSLPPFWLVASHLNPVFYMTDGFRYGFFGQSDVAPGTSFLVVAGCFVAISSFTLLLLRSGYKLRY